MQESKQLRISVVIAMRNEERYIGKCIDSFLEQTLPKDQFELIVIDGHSNDSSRKIVKRYQNNHTDLPIRLYDNPQKIQAAAWNMGFAKAAAEFVVMMGAHSFVDHDFLKQNIKALETHPEVPCVGGIVTALGADNKSKAIALSFNSVFGVGNARYRYAQEECYVETVNYGAYRKSMIKAIGPIDETIIRGQDWEYNFRLVKKFGKMFFTPLVKVYYNSRENYKKLWKKQFDAGLWKAYIIKKHKDSMLLRHLVPFLFVFMFLFFTILSVVKSDFIYIGAYLGFYILVNFAFSLGIAVKNKLSLLPYIMFSFFIMHTAYGIGSLLGLIHQLFSRSKQIA